MRVLLRWRWAVALLLTAACGGGPSPTDAGATAEDGSPPALDMPAVSLELATGPPGVWTSFEDGDELLLQRGCQGSQHVFVSARARGFDEERLTIDLSIQRERDSEVVSLPHQLRLVFPEDPATGAQERTGLTVVVPVPSDIVGEAIRIDGEIWDEGGQRATATRFATVRWGPDACG